MNEQKCRNLKRIWEGRLPCKGSCETRKKDWNFLKKIVQGSFDQLGAKVQRNKILYAKRNGFD